MRILVAGVLCLLATTFGAMGQTTQPLVAIHDSELTRALETMPAVSPTPTDVGTTGFQWWLTDWHYFVMPDTVKETLRSDGTAFTVIGDSNISAGLLLGNGMPKYPIIVSLSSEAMRDDEIAPLTNYVAAGGFLFIGGSAFTRDPNGFTRGDFAIANQMGVHMVNPSVANWTRNSTVTRLFNHRLVSHIPDGQLNWRMPATSDEINWGISPDHVFTNAHDLWQVQVSNATVIAQGDNLPFLTVTPYGKGYFIYDAAFQPLMGNGGFAPSMYPYEILRKSIEWAFESARLAVPKLSPWPYAYDAAFTVRHDLENFSNEIADIELSAGFEFTNGVKGDYYFCTGTLRQDMAGTYNTNAVVQSLRRAMTNFGATIGPHNGGLGNINNHALAETNYDYWHWGPDEALDVTLTNYPNGTAYAFASLSNAFKDIESWLPGLMTTNMRIWTAPNFNATREPSYLIQEQLGVKIAGDQKISPFPHWTLSTQTPDKRYAMLTVPVSDWFANGMIAQSLEPWHPPGYFTNSTLHDAIDFYYALGGLINFYSHTLSTGEGGAGQLVPDYITYSMNTNLHPRLWAVNSIDIYNWWLQRTNAKVSVVSAVTNGNQNATIFTISGATSPNTAVELVLPGQGIISGLQVVTNGTLASGNSYRVTGQTLKLSVGTSVTNAVVIFSVAPNAQSDYYSLNTGTNLSVAAPGVLVNDTASAGSTSLTAVLVSNVAHGMLNLHADGSFTYAPTNNYTGIDSFTYQANDGVTNSVVTSVTLNTMPRGELYADDFTRSIGPNALAPWTVSMGTWAITNGSLQGSSVTQEYGYAYINQPSWTDYSVQADVQLPAGVFGGGIGGRLNPATGAHYGAWIFPEDSSGGSSVLKLIKYLDWNDWSGTPMQQVDLPDGVGTNAHNLKLDFSGTQISVSVDDSQLISVTDTNNDQVAPYLSGGICTEMWTDGDPYVMSVDNFFVTPAYSSPVANNDDYSASQGTLLSVAAPGVLGDDDGGLGTLTAQLVGTAGLGNVNLNADGSFTYTPPGQFTGVDEFTYQITDGITTSSLATVNITVNTTNLPPVGHSDFYTFRVNTRLIVSEPGLLNNDTDPNGDSLTAILVNGPTNGTLTLNANGAFTYVPNTDFNGTDTFTYQAFDGQTTSGPTTVTLVDPVSGVLFSDNFSRTNGLLAPWIAYSNNWAVTNGVLRGGLNPMSTYAFVYSTNTFTNFSVQGRIQFSTTSAFGGGIGGCLNPLTGAHYAAWVYPEGSPVGSAMMNIVKFHTWDSWGLNGVPFTPVATATNLPGGVGTNFHTIKLAFSTNQIAAYYDGIQVISVADTESPAYLSGAIVADMWTDLIQYNLNFDDIVVSTLVVDDNYTTTANAVLTVPAPGVLGNDTEVYGTGLKAFVIANPTNGTLALNTNGGFLYTPFSNYFGPDSFTYTAIDGQTNLGAATVNLTVNGSHNGPSLRTFTNNIVSIDENPITVTNTAVDTDSPAWTLTYSLVSPPAGLTITTNGIIHWTPINSQSPSSNIITTVVTDNAPSPISATNTVTIVINEVNVAPVLPAQTNRTINELTPLVVTNTATEPNGNSTTISYTLISPQQGMNIDANGIFTWQPTQSQSPSTNTVTVVVLNSDPQDSVNPVLTATINFKVFVNELNVAPTLLSPGLQNVNETVPLVVTNVALETNIHSATIGFGLISPLAGMTITSNGVFNWTPSQTQSPSTNLVTVVVTNSNPFDSIHPILTTTNSFSVIVKEINVAPQLPIIAQQTVNEQVLLTVTNTAIEPNIHAVTTGYGLVSPLSGMNISSNGIFTWQPTQSQSPSSNTVTVVVTNNDVFDIDNPVLISTNSFIVKVREVNIAPQFPIVGVQTANEQLPLLVTNTVTESNIHAVTTGYGIISPLSGMTISSNGVFSWTPAQGQSPSTNTISIVATNSDVFDTVNPVLVATNIFTVKVVEVNVTPVLASVSQQTVNEQILLTVTNTATEPNIHSTNAGFGLINPLTGMQMSSNGIFTWTPAQTQSPSTNTVTVVVTNNNPFDLVNPRLTSTNNFSVIVKEVNIAPVLPAISNVFVNEQIPLTVTNTATEPNIHAVTTAYGLINPLTGMNISSNGIFTWTPSQTQSPSTNLVTVVVTNSDTFDTVNPVLSTTNSFTVIVNESNLPPIFAGVTNQFINELLPLTVTNSVTEPNIHAVITGYGLVGALAGMNVDSNGVFTWTPQQTQSPSANLITVVATNLDSLDPVNPILKSTNTFTVFVREVNVAPVPTAIGTQTVNELAPLVLTATVTEPNIHSVTTNFSLINPVSGMTITSNGVFSWTPQQVQSPSSNLVTIVTTNFNPFDTNNPVLTATNSFSVIVKEVNVAPQFPNISLQTVNELTPLTINAAVTEPNIHAATMGYAIINPLTGMNIDSSGNFTWTPQISQGPSTNFVTLVVINNDPYDTVNPQLTAFTSFTVVVKEANIAPLVAGITNQMVNELTLLTVTNFVTEPNPHAVTTGFGLLNPLAGMNVNSNGVFTWTPSQTQSPGTNLVSVIVTNSDTLDTVNPILTATNTFTVIVKEVNVAPQPPVIGLQTVNELAPLIITNTATETNIHSVITGYTITSPLVGMNVNSSGIFTWTPQISQGPSTNLVTIVVANSNAFDTINPVLTATNSFTVIVNEANIPPLFGSVSTQTVNEQVPLTVTSIVVEPNAHAVTTGFGLIAPLSGMNITSNGVFTWTPTQSQSPSSNLVTVVATNYDALDTNNPILTATNTFTILVREVNIAPVLTGVSTQTVNEQIPLTVTNLVTEPNIHATTTGFGLIAPLSGMNITSNGVFTWTPTQSQSPSTNTVTVVVTNSDAFDTINPVLTATNTFTVIVKEVNIAPVLTGISTQTVNELVPLLVTNIATEPNIHATTTGFGLIAPLSGMNITSNGVFSWTPTQSQSPSTNTITVVVTNSDVFDTVNPTLTATNSFIVIVKEVNVAPILTSVNTQTVNEQVPLFVTNLVTEPNTHATTTGFSLIAPLSGMNITSNGVFTWTPTQSQSPSTNTVTVVVTNSDAFDTVNPTLTATNSFVIIVKEVNVAPVFVGVGPQTVAAQSPFVVTNAATEPNIHSTTVGYGLISAPVGATINASGIITWTPPAQGTNTITTVVTNNNAFDTVRPTLTATNSFTIVITPSTNNPPPTLLPITISNGIVTLTWNSVSGRLYRVQYTTAMNSNWTSMFPDVIATGSNSTKTDVVSASQKFYRVLLLPANQTNTAPVLTGQSNQTMTVNTALTVTNTATDSDFPANVLTYQLANPPSGAAISANGIITWTPSSVGTNTITTVVYDNGVPAKSATNSFQVFVLPVNTAPVLPAQSNLSVTVSNLVTVTNTATDSDVPANTLTYHLVNPPLNAAISSNGVITWTPQTMGTNTITTVVTDNGYPSLSATNSFQVVVNPFVNPSPAITSLVASNNTFTLTWGSVAGKTYRVQYCSSIPTTNWQTLTDVLATNTVCHATDASTGVSQRFYRILVLNNNAPVLQAQTNRTINALSTLVVTNAGTDTDIPANILSYQLVNPPSGATITSNGVITWTPQTTGTNTITTIVTDNGSPQLSATNQFNVIVVPPLSIQSVSFFGTNAVITWASLAGRNYQLQYKNTLSSTNWNIVSPQIPSAGATTSVTNGAVSQRYFRLVLM